jgi:hypothetical protein
MGLALLLCVGVAVAAINVELEFNAWASKYGVVYKTAEERAFRLGVFEASLQVVTRCNQRHARGEASFTCGQNKFMDATREERTKLRGFRSSHKTHEPIETYIYRNVQAASAVDWVKAGKVGAAIASVSRTKNIPSIPCLLASSAR